MLKKIIKNYAVVAVSALILAIAFNVSMFPLEIVTGGSTGVSIIVQYFLGIDPYIVIFLCYIFAFIIGFIFLGKKVIKKSIFGTIIYPLFIYITMPLSNYIKAMNLNSSECLILVVVGAIASGIAYGLVYKIGYTTGGSDIASQIINKYFGVTIGTSDFIFNAIIAIAGGALFGWTKVMYAVLTLYIIGIVTDRVLLGSSYSKAFYIITDKVDEVKQYIFDEFRQGVTEFDSVGGYTNNNNQVLMCVVPTNDYFKLKEGINIIDQQAFFVIMDAYELKTRA